MDRHRGQRAESVRDALIGNSMTDDATAVYILENQRCFENLKQVASQLAGWLVLAAAGSNEAVPDHPVLLRARETYRDVEDALRQARPTDRALKHYRHLASAAQSIGIALKNSPSVDRMLPPLRAGYSELERAADSLPGFEKIAYGGACCAQGHRA
jgi:hypothetical protein